VAVNGSESGCSGEAEVCLAGDMLIHIGIPVLLRQTKINEIHHIRPHPNAHDNVAGFEITVNEIAGVNVL
jgi:hypothetical protein